MKTLRVLFICGKNRRRSPTAEVVIGRLDGVIADSAGTAHDADVVVTAEHIAVADVIVVMEPRQRRQLRQRFSADLKDKRVVCVDIADDFEFMDDRLVELLLARVPPLLR